MLMNTISESKYSVVVLSVLLDIEPSQKSKSDFLNGVKWDGFLNFAQKQVILLRSYEKFIEMGICPEGFFCEAVTRERNRIRHTVELIGKLGEICQNAGIRFVFPKAILHLPDMGQDVDLLVQDRSRRIDALIAESLGSSYAAGSLVNWISGKTGYNVGKYPSPVEIHHGRMGHLGEHNIYPHLLLRNSKDISIGKSKAFVPSPEDQLIIQVLQRVYCHMIFRLSDIVSSIRLVQSIHLNWDYIVETTRRIGIFGGLCHHLSYIDQIFLSVFGKTAIPKKVSGLSKYEATGRVYLKNGFYSFPVFSVGSKLYLKKFVFELRDLNWDSLSRICLLPLLVIYIGLRSLGRWLFR